MKHLRTRFFALCGLMVLFAAALVPVVAEAGCPSIVVECSNGKMYSCAGTQQGDKCIYSASCLNGGKCGSGGEFEIESGPEN